MNNLSTQSTQYNIEEVSILAAHDRLDYRYIVGYLNEELNSRKKIQADINFTYRLDGQIHTIWLNDVMLWTSIDCVNSVSLYGSWLEAIDEDQLNKEFLEEMIIDYVEEQFDDFVDFLQTLKFSDEYYDEEE